MCYGGGGLSEAVVDHVGILFAFVAGCWDESVGVELV